MQKRIESNEKFTDEEIAEFVYAAVNILQYLNSRGLDVRTSIDHGYMIYFRKLFSKCYKSKFFNQKIFVHGWNYKISDLLFRFDK